jgi:type II restriction enzyme
VDLRLDLDLAADLKSSSQAAKAFTEDWVSREAFCLSCGRDRLRQTPPNTEAMDFRCEECDEPYELKASRRPFHDRVLNGEYSTLVRALASRDNPNLMLLNYDLSKMEVTDFRAIPRYAFSRMNIIPRRPLGPNARRAGWQGCNIDLAGLPPAAIVGVVLGGVVRSPKSVVQDWHRFDFIDRARGQNRHWLPDVLACLRRIQEERFTLETVYGFASELRLLHPRNLNIEPKIRQQLQILVAQGVIERESPGVYRKTSRF